MRILKFGLLGLAGALLIVYGIDWAAVTFKAPAYADIPTYQVYTDTNKWKETEYSRDPAPVTERCIYSLFPQKGFRPCWYVTRHTVSVTNTD